MDEDKNNINTRSLDDLSNLDTNKTSEEIMNDQQLNEDEVKAFEADLKLAEFNARIENGQISPDEKATLEMLAPHRFDKK